MHECLLGDYLEWGLSTTVRHEGQQRMHGPSPLGLAEEVHLYYLYGVVPGNRGVSDMIGLNIEWLAGLVR